jgi:coproporphyrinogen III oxidase-like Fe-S oxidoreductase
MLNAVRLKQPIKLVDFSYRTGLDQQLLIKKLSYAKQAKWLEFDEQTIELTEKGYLISDEIVKLLL